MMFGVPAAALAMYHTAETKQKKRVYGLMLAGAGFIVALTGAIMTMPGLPKKPAALNMDVTDDGHAVGLF